MVDKLGALWNGVCSIPFENLYKYICNNIYLSKLIPWYDSVFMTCNISKYATTLKSKVEHFQRYAYMLK